MLDPKLIEAYHQTNYVVFVGKREVTIRIGEVPQLFLDLIPEAAMSTWAFITAANPRSQQLPEEENTTRNGLLIDELACNCRMFLRGEGRGVARDWPAEKSVCIIGLTKAEATKLAKKFDQNAIVWGKGTGKAELVVIA